MRPTTTRTDSVLGAELYAELCHLTERARLQATSTRNFHAAALCVVLEALRVQAENAGTKVAVYITPEVV